MFPQQKILAIIITYNPDEEFLDNLKGLAHQVSQVLVVDNSTHPDRVEWLKSNQAQFKYELILNSHNIGIAAALNKGVRYGQKNKFDWLLTLDQDSIISENYVNKMLSAYFESPEKHNIGIMAPVHYDKKTGYQSRDYRDIKGPYVRKDIVLTSGNLIPIQIYDKVGLYNEDLFIEYVDHEYCLRIKKAKLKTVILSNVLLAHSLGNIKRHDWPMFSFFSHNYLPVRRYYRARNRLYLYKRHFGLWIIQDQEFAIKDALKIILVEEYAFKKLWAIIIGTIHGLLGRKGSYEEALYLRKQLLKKNQQVKEDLLSSLNDGGWLEKQIVKNSFYNFLGHLFPLIVGLLTIPKIINHLGMERFGLLTIIWAVIGYFSLFDFGLSRAMTVKISELTSKKNFDLNNKILWTSLKFIFLATICGSFLLVGFTYFPEHFSENASPQVFAEGLLSLRMMALTLPAITLTAGLKGALEADHRFLGLNIIQSVLGALNFLVPFIIALESTNLFHIVIALSILRYIFLLVHFLYLKSTSVWLKSPVYMTLKESKPLLISGGWLTVSNVVSPIMVYFDRFLLAIMIPSSLIGYYTTPFEIVNRLLVIPSSVTRALFPILASQDDLYKSKQSYRISMIMISVISLIIVIIGITFGAFALRVWLGGDFAEKSYKILFVLLLGFFTNALAWTPFSLIQALQRPDLTAKIHLFELPFYCILLLALVQQYGLVGAAMAWTFRNTFDLIIMTVISKMLRKKMWSQPSYEASLQTSSN